MSGQLIGRLVSLSMTGKQDESCEVADKPLSWGHDKWFQIREMVHAPLHCCGSPPVTPRDVNDGIRVA